VNSFLLDTNIPSELTRSQFAGRTLLVTDVIAERWGVLDGERQLQGMPLNTAGLGVSLFNPWEVQ
jgi:hypothetical protein